MTMRRCPGCRGWYEKRIGACPRCSEPKAKVNAWLEHARLNEGMYQQVRETDPRAQHARLKKEIKGDLDRMVREA